MRGGARGRPDDGLRRATLLLMVTVGMLAGCGRARPPDAAVDVQARSQALIDAGNLAYRAGDYGLAARRYAAAAAVQKDDPAAYYGLGMALAKLGRDEDARVAYARARELTQKHANPSPARTPPP